MDNSKRRRYLRDSRFPTQRGVEFGGIRGGETVVESRGLPLFIGTVSRPAAPVATVASWAQTTIINWPKPWRIGVGRTRKGVRTADGFESPKRALGLPGSADVPQQRARVHIFGAACVRRAEDVVASTCISGTPVTLELKGNCYAPLSIEAHREALSTVILESVLTCPNCGQKREEVMPTDACQYFYECTSCKTCLNLRRGLLRFLLLRLNGLPPCKSSAAAVH